MKNPKILEVGLKNLKLKNIGLRAIPWREACPFKLNIKEFKIILRGAAQPRPDCPLPLEIHCPQAYAF